MKKHRVVIVGGGFGGVKAALELAGDDRFTITLITTSPDFTYYPSLYHTALGGRRAGSIIPLSDFFEGKGLTVVVDPAKTVDRKAKTIITKSGEVVPYDSAIFALGVITNYFGIPGLEEYSFGIKSDKEIKEFKKHLHTQLINEMKPDLNYVVVGGGPTGIELAGALPGYLKHIMKMHGIRGRAVHVDLIEANPRLLPRLPRDAGRIIKRRLRRLGVKVYTGAKVEGAAADSLTVSGKPIQSHTVIWTAGVTNNPFFAANNFTVTKNGKVAVDVYQRTEPDMYVIGDNANTPYSGMAQTAVEDARQVAANLRRVVTKRDLKEYKVHEPWSVIPVGPRWAAAMRGGFRTYGLLGAFLRRASDFVAFHDYQPFIEAGHQWARQFGSEESCEHCRRQLASDELTAPWSSKL